MRALLDVNVLIALLDAAHQHHASARQWLETNIGHGWASCPLTQNGCLRIMSQPSYPGAQAPAAMAQRLREATETPPHAFWPELTPEHLDSIADMAARVRREQGAGTG
jgi:toxin-antitoxin system PIN domain toxin